jgi:hypothetical protein
MLSSLIPADPIWPAATAPPMTTSEMTVAPQTTAEKRLLKTFMSPPVERAAKPLGAHARDMGGAWAS